MSTKKSVKDDQENSRFTVQCLDQPSFKNDVENYPDLFLAASMQFLHRLLAERTSQYAKLEANGIPTAESQVQDVPQQENNITRQLYFEQIDQIEEYKRQLHSIENFFSTIQFNEEKPVSSSMDCDAIILKDTIDVRPGEDTRNLESKKLHDNSYCSNYPYSVLNYDQSSVDTSQLHKINIVETEDPASAGLTVRKTVPDKSDLTGHLKTQSVTSNWTGLKNNSIQSSASYADIVRNAVSGLARNCGKKYKNRRRNRAANSWLREAEIMEGPKEGRYQSECQNESEYEISSESQAGDGQDSDILKQIPIRVQLATESDSSPRKPVTLLVRVPNAVFNLLNRKVSKEDTKILSPDPLAKVNTEPGKRKKRITSVFRNFLKGRRTPSSTTVYSATEKLQSSVALALAETFNDEEDQGNDISRNPFIYTLQKSASCNSFELKRKSENSYEAINKPTIELQNTKRTSLKRVLVPPTKSVNGYEKISLNLNPGVISSETESWNGKAAGIVRRKLVDDKALRTEVPLNKTKIVKGLTNYCDEKIIPLRCSEGSPQLGNKCGAGISQRDVDIFLKLAKEMRKFQVYNQDVNWKHVEIPVEIKTTETLLRLQKKENVSADFLDHRVFQPESKTSQTTAGGIETQQFLEMLVESLSKGAYLPSTEYSESQELPSSLNTVENKPQENFKLTKNSVDSALEVLLRHIGTSTSIMSCTKPYADEKDTTVQTAPKRQLSKISVCYSSESLSGSEHETPAEIEIEDSTVSQDEYRVYNDVLSKESRKINKQQYFHHYETIEQDYTDNCENDKVVFPDTSEDIYAGVKIQSCIDSAKITKEDNSNQNLSPFGTAEARRIKLPPCIRTEVIIEEQNYDTIETGVKAQGVIDCSKSTSLSIRDTEKTVFCHPTVLSKQIFGDNKELADAMIRWWGPEINYSTTPSSQTQLSGYSVSINNLI